MISLKMASEIIMQISSQVLNLEKNKSEVEKENKRVNNGGKTNCLRLIQPESSS